MWSSFKIAFSMYSKIPMPETEWNKKTMKYAMCFFPLIGIVIGIAVFLAAIIFKYTDFNIIFKSMVYTVIPVIITGGIHTDGFVDTMDAVNSYADTDRKLEILKDSHIGAFALIMCTIYFIAYFGIWSEISIENIIPVSMGFVLSRALSGLAVVTFPCAKKSGLAAQFSDAAQKKTVKVTMIVYIIVISLFIIAAGKLEGAASLCAGFLMFLYYKKMSKEKFGGITGDLAGYFLQMCELLMPAAFIITEKIIKLSGVVF